MQPDVKDQTRQELSSLTEWSGRLALEIGCGDGRLSALLASLGCDLVAIDPDASQLMKAQRTFAEVDFLCASGGSLPFPEGTFDQVIFTLSLHHQDPVRALNEAKRVIKPKGRIIVLEPTGESEIERLCRLFHDETEVQNEARRALARIPPTSFVERAFQTEWHFESAEEAVGGLFAYFGRERDADLVTAIMEIIGSRHEDRPLCLRDHLYLGCLQFG